MKKFKILEEVMSIQLALIRHGDAPYHIDDHQRQLSQLGKKEAETTGQYLQEISFIPQEIFHSGLDRARDTTQIIRDTLGINTSIQISPDLRPESNPVIWENNLMVLEKNTMIVSHMPYLPMLLELLCNRRVSFPTAGCVILEKAHFDDPHWKIVRANF
ncbi:MAG: hypothetical protein CME60_13545 [Halobacteriovoraceae bacterium]|nr:hypothetical protein [Halobacteriovoraceae bacterium]